MILSVIFGRILKIIVEYWCVYVINLGGMIFFFFHLFGLYFLFRKIRTGTMEIVLKHSLKAMRCKKNEMCFIWIYLSFEQDKRNSVYKKEILFITNCFCHSFLILSRLMLWKIHNLNILSLWNKNNDKHMDYLHV